MYGVDNVYPELSLARLGVVEACTTSREMGSKSATDCLIWQVWSMDAKVNMKRERLERKV